MRVAFPHVACAPLVSCGNAVLPRPAWSIRCCNGQQRFNTLSPRPCADTADRSGPSVAPEGRGEGLLRLVQNLGTLTLTLWRDCVGAGRSPSQRERGKKQH